jgi:hypothetical protein
LSLVSHFRIIEYLQVRPEPTHKYQTRLKILANDKRYSLLIQIIYDDEKYITLVPSIKIIDFFFITDASENKLECLSFLKHFQPSLICVSRLWPYLQILNKVEMTYQGQTL